MNETCHRDIMLFDSITTALGVLDTRAVDGKPVRVIHGGEFMSNLGCLFAALWRAQFAVAHVIGLSLLLSPTGSMALYFVSTSLALVHTWTVNAPVKIESSGKPVIRRFRITFGTWPDRGSS